jgi:hypothetical protein
MERGDPPALKAPTPGCLWIYLFFLALPNIVISLVTGLFPTFFDRSGSLYWLQKLIIRLVTILLLFLAWRCFPRLAHRMDYLEQQVFGGEVRAWSLKGLGIIFGFFEVFVVLATFQEGWRLFFISTIGSFLVALYLWTIVSWADTFSKRGRTARFLDACLLLGAIASGFVGIIYLIYVLPQIIR